RGPLVPVRTRHGTCDDGEAPRPGRCPLPSPEEDPMNPLCRSSLHCLAALSVSLLFVSRGAADPAEKEIERLVEQLGSDVFQEREQASRRLEEIGKPALGALRKAMTGADPEVRRRAATIVGAIDDKVVKEELEHLQGAWKPVSAEYE